jgi:flagellar biosynthetic protein FliQ
MNDVHMLNAMREMLYYAMMGVCIVTIPALILGVILSVLQTATQINEMTLTFVPKFLVMCALLFILGPWLMERLVIIMNSYMNNLPLYIR